jgi:hypothetical protein
MSCMSPGHDRPIAMTGQICSQAAPAPQMMCPGVWGALSGLAGPGPLVVLARASFNGSPNPGDIWSTGAN